ncbi:FAD-dependent tricarballylate dehydrogenase TcuA [Roseospira marina]|uniref:FAD-dependent tricarballylate dehydrogenase TcuA n=1 Tax=Roseospira marina TaxID=140057 RepID=UPI0017C528F8|nr:FAD-dependent tricarballylate dehydrogenase TcuA [Roseospira marina]MBB4314702.1 tricarballylate dehydrogenase [Roseospira marina]MBB5087691.1 tricarballylate dehydrogenase [Roseospira marina]
MAGGGLAALCAALAARRKGARVWLVDAAPPILRGGNTRHARNMRVAHDGPSALVPDAYSVAAFAADLRRADPAADPALVETLAADSVDLPRWLAGQGVAFQPRADGMIPYSRRTVFLLGGGTAMVNALYRTAMALGVRVRHDTRVEAVTPEGRVTLRRGEARSTVAAHAVVVATGGFQANRRWLAEAFGPDAVGFVNRGTPHADGALLRALLEAGAAPVGEAAHAHIVAVDARSPADDGGIVTRADGMPWGLVLDRDGRPVDDGAHETGSARYSAWGRLVAGCPGALAHVILDAAGVARLGRRVYPPETMPDTDTLARALALDPGALAATLDRAGPAGGPPWHVIPIRPGITFTGLGVRVDAEGRVRDGAGETMPGLFAAGMIMAPGVLGGRYLSGTALTISAVFGRRAGEAAARHAFA